MKHDVNYYRMKLGSWFPHWNLDRFTDAQIISIYRREAQKTANEIEKQNGKSITELLYGN
jgi:hypothetical protein